MIHKTTQSILGGLNLLTKLRGFKYCLLLIAFAYIGIVQAQCTGCTSIVNNFTSSSNYTFTAGTTTCFTGTSTINNDITLGNNGLLCVGPGATLNIGANNFTAAATDKFTINVYGTLNITTGNSTLNNKIDINIYNGGKMTTNTLTLNGSVSSITNNGTFNPGTLQFQGSSSTVTIINNSNMSVGATLNVSTGNSLQFQNNGALTVAQSFNSSPTSVYVSCGSFSGKFNLNGGGKVINTGTFTTTQIDFGSSASRFENFGKVYANGSVNLSSGTIYNEGIFDLQTSGIIQSDGNLKGPTDNTKKGYFIWSGKNSMNNGSIGPNLDFKNSSGTSSKAAMFAGSSGITETPTITYGGTAPGTLPAVTCFDATGVPTTPVATSNTACSGVNLTTLQPTLGGVTYEWWTGTATSRTTQITGATSPTVTNYTTVGQVYLWAKSVSGTNLYSASGSVVNITAAPTITTAATPAVVAAVCQSASLQITTMAYNATTNSPTSYSIDWATLADQVSTTFAFTTGAGNITGITVPAGTAAGTYTGTMTITNGSGCTGTKSITLTVNALPTITTAATPAVVAAVCESSSALNTTMAYTATTHSPTSYSIDWLTLTDQGSTAFAFVAGAGSVTGIIVPSGTAAGTYTGTMTITNANGCMGIKSITLTVNATPTITTAATATSVCFSSSIQTTPLTYSAVTGTPTTYSIVWNASPANSFVAVTNAALPASPISISVPASTASGTYTGTITVKNANGCVSSGTTFTVTVSSAIATNTIGTAQTICSGTTPAALTGSTPTGGSGTYVYLWESSTTSASAGFGNAAGTNSNIGYSPVSLSATTWFRRTVTSGGCSNTSTAIQITVNSTPTPTATVVNATCSDSTDGSITLISPDPIPVEFKNADKDYIDLGTTYLSNRTAFTIEGWIKFKIADLAGTSRVGLFGQNNAIEFGFINPTTIELYTTGGGSFQTPIPTALGDNTWHHIAAVGTGAAGGMTIYIDGVSVATGGTAIATNYGASTFTTKIGNKVIDDTDAGYPGQIKKFGVYSTALSAATIASLASTPTVYSGSETGLLAGYNFSDATGTILTKVPVGTNGTFTNTPEWIYTYSWTKTGTPAYTATTRNISSLAPGDYNLTMNTIGTGCPVTKTFTVGFTNSRPSAPIVATPTQPSCSTATGSVFVSGLPATGTWTLTRSGTSGATTVSSGTDITVSGLAAGSYTFTVTQGACSSSASTSITITGLTTTTWSGTAWSSGTPTLNTLAILNGNYDTATYPDINACTLTINGGFTLTIQNQKFVTIQNDLTVNTGSVVEIKNQGSLVMINDAGVLTTVGTGKFNVNKTTTSFEKYDYTYWATPLAGTTTIATVFPTWRLDKAYEFHPENFIDLINVLTGQAIPDGFDDNENDWLTTSSMNPGRGYIIMGPTSGSFPRTESVVFTGKVNTGVITTPIQLTPDTTDPEDDFNLVGNPYPCAISADALINANITGTGTLNKTIDGTLWFWTHKADIASASNGLQAYNYSQDDYAVYTLAGGTGTTASASGGAKPLGYIASGQGFFVEATAAGTLTFNNSMRVSPAITASPVTPATANAQFYKTMPIKPKAADKNRIWLNLENELGMFSQQLVAYFDNTTLGRDNGYDGLLSDAGNYINFYSIENNDAFKIQARPTFTQDDEVPLGYFSAVAGTFNINIDSKEGVFNDGANVYLEDKLVEVIHDLKAAPYTFTTEEGTFDDRFVLRYTNKSLGTGDFDALKNTVLVAVKSKKITINSFAETLDKVAIYDVLGKQLYKKSMLNANELSILNLPSSEQTLLVKVTLQSGQTVTKKVIY
ncbi:T9SS sorting signal type C domain-containing protein [Flavobacterium restrictum]|uniref:T9SS sorting signal type C domain-containing protein n=1 Tax=Flavobacterium restrictum TaxID=2594428 RepID=A0A553E660_9FLAO|nr:T9SS sorting signal type C domain-containing protein [Flavobacterium restrictum]TRX40504.1 T9SS sorting signal type C domain-containing protein [Flavobacterium restrictum]